MECFSGCIEAGESDYPIALGGLHQGYSLGAPALNSDTLDRCAGYDAVGGYEHDFLRWSHQPGVNKVTCFINNLKGPDPATGTVLSGVVVSGGELTEALGGNHQQQGTGTGDTHTDDAVIGGGQADTTYAATGPGASP